MVHSIRKYLCNRGSALFMVLTTMTALMITCMAMYFAVVSSRSAGFAVFNQQQSYQSAISVADMVIADFNTIMTNSGASIENTDYGKTILSTNGNGFKSLTSNPNAADDDDYIGAYDVTMTRLPDEKIDGKTYFTVDIAVTSSVSGVKEVYHQIVNILEEESTPPSKGKIFASTGYVPNDSFISRGHFYSDVYISNEDVVVGAFSGTELFFYSDIFCENSLSFVDGAHFKNSAPKAVVHAIRGDYNLLAGDSLDIVGKSYFLVGNDMHLATKIQTGNLGSNLLEIYIGGDLYLEGGEGTKDSNIRVFVAGDVYVNTGATGLPKTVYCNKIINNSGAAIPATWEENYSKNTSTAEWWQLDKDTENNWIKHGDMSLTFQEAMELLDEKTPDINYKLWKVDESKFAGQIGKLDANGKVTMSDGKSIEPIVFELIDPTKDQMFKPVVLTYSESNKGCVVKDIIMKGGNVTDTSMPTIIIDTGDDESNTFVLRLQNNRVTKDGKEYFTWSPKLEYTDWSTGTPVLAYSETNHPIQIFVKGNGSVVIEVPEGVVYQDTSKNRIAHYNWYMLTDQSGMSYINGVGYYTSKQDAFRDGTTFSPYVHGTCGDNCSCRYTSKKTNDVCPNCGNEKLYTVTCSDHGEFSLCPNCDSQHFDTNGKPKTSGLGLCKDKVNIDKCIADLAASDNATTHPVNKDTKGNIIVPNCNIYLVSCSESAEFRFGRGIDDESSVVQSCFAGFIYAPYMSYLANASANGNYLMHMGGMVVSDYKFMSDNSFLACWPSVYPPENVLDDSSLDTNLKPVTEKRYRVRLKATY